MDILTANPTVNVGVLTGLLVIETLSGGTIGVGISVFRIYWHGCVCPSSGILVVPNNGSSICILESAYGRHLEGKLNLYSSCPNLGNTQENRFTSLSTSHVPCLLPILFSTREGSLLDWLAFLWSHSV